MTIQAKIHLFIRSLFIVHSSYTYTFHCHCHGQYSLSTSIPVINTPVDEIFPTSLPVIVHCPGLLLLAPFVIYMRPICWYFPHHYQLLLIASGLLLLATLCHIHETNLLLVGIQQHVDSCFTHHIRHIP